MSPPDSHRPTKLIREVFVKARQIAAGQERDRYLAAICGNDEELLHEVVALLEAEGDTGTFLDKYAIGSLSDSDEEMLGKWIGHYQILEHLGEGGFGDVYRVEQTEPLHRQVAMKIIKPGIGDKDIVNRFKREREALAIMDHPNIAHILDAGETDDGRPYFIMDLVCGVPITQYCDEQSLSIEDRLDLFRTVCSAVQHAHQKGILHRDLKPSNVVVVEKGDKVLPMVIDFGIAKPLRGGFKEHPLVTQVGFFIGTPAYMSPEQVCGVSEHLDTRADVYSLGILLYELLTGVRPFEDDTLHKAALAEVQRIICEEYPDKPSTRIREIGKEAEGLAQKQSVDTSTLIRKLEGDLDWIVMKAIEKDREMRYQGVGELVADIGRHQNHEPVSAGAPGPYYLFKKFIHRHRMATVITGTLIPFFIIGFISTYIGFYRAKEERDRATLSELIAQVEAAKAHTFRTILLPYLFPSGEEKEWGSINIAVPEMEETSEIFHGNLHDTLDALSVKVAEELTEQPRLEVEVRKLLAESYLNVGLDKRAWEHLEMITKIQGHLYGLDSVEYADSLASYALALDKKFEFVPKSLMALDYMDKPPSLFKRLLKAMQLSERALGIYRKLNHSNRLHLLMLQYLGQRLPLDDQGPVLQEMISMAEATYTREDPRILLFEESLAEHYFNSGQFDEAEKALERIISLAEQHDDGPFVWTFPEGIFVYLRLLDRRGELDRGTAFCRKILKHLESKDRGVSFIYYRSLLHWIYKWTKDPLIEQKILNLEYHKALSPGRSRVDYDIQINQPGTYRLYVRWDGHNLWSDSFFARLRKVMDGVGGEIADYYGFVRNIYPPDADFATAPVWQSDAGFETIQMGGTTHTTAAQMNPPGGLKEAIAAEWTIKNTGMYTLQLMEIEPGVAVDAFILQLVGQPPPVDTEMVAGAMPPEGFYEMMNGRVVIEAENFTGRFDGIGPGWTIVPTEQKPRIQFLNYTGSGYIQILPEPLWIDSNTFEPMRGSRYVPEGKWNRSIAYFDEAVRIDFSPNNLSNRAKKHLQLGNYDWVAADCSSVLDMSEIYFIKQQFMIDAVRAWRAICWLRIGRFDEGIDYRIDPQEGIPSTLYSQEYIKTYNAMYHALNGHWMKAHDCIDENTSNGLLLCFKGDLYAMSGDFKTAREYFLRATDSMIESYLRLAGLYLISGDRKLLDEVIKHYPMPDADNRYEQIIFLYLSCLGADTCPAPEKFFSIASNLEQHNESIFNPSVKRQRAEVIGAAYFRMGMFDKSIQLLEEAHDSDGRTWQGNRSRWMFFLAMAHYNKGNINKALSSYEKAVLAFNGDMKRMQLFDENLNVFPWFEVMTLENLKKETELLLGIDSEPVQVLSAF